MPTTRAADEGISLMLILSVQSRQRFHVRGAYCSGRHHGIARVYQSIDVISGHLLEVRKESQPGRQGDSAFSRPIGLRGGEVVAVPLQSTRVLGQAVMVARRLLCSFG